MALIKCKECGNKISDQAETCPKCGYELKPKQDNKIVEKVSDKIGGNKNLKYLLIALVVIVGGYFLFFNNKTNNTNTDDGTTTPTPSPSNNGNYVFNQSGMYFEYPSNYQTYVDKEGSLYVAQNIDKQGALIPYIIIDRYKSYTDPKALISDFTTAIANEYPDVAITINMLSNYIGDKYVYGIQYTYTSSGHVVVDNRYAFLVNGKMYLIGTKEENVNTDEINNTTRLIIETLKEVS